MHVPAGETLPPTNVHSGNPVVNEQGVPPNLLGLMPHAGATIVLLNLHALNYPFELSTALTKFTGRSGDVLLVAACKPPDLLAFSGDL